MWTGIRPRYDLSHERARSSDRRSLGALRRMVCPARLAAARASARDAGGRRARQVAPSSSPPPAEERRSPAFFRRSSSLPGSRRRGSTRFTSRPLKALAVDIHRNLEQPIAEMGLATPRRDAHRRHAAGEARAPARERRRSFCSRHPSRLPFSSPTRIRRGSSRASAASSSTSCTRLPTTSGAIFSPSAWRGSRQ